MDSPTATGSRRGIALPLAVAVFATLLLALCTVLATRVSITRLLDCGARQRDVERWTADVARLDEVLTMSANMAAATGDMRWRQRYDQHVPALDEAIAALRAVSPTLFDRELGADTDAANQRLIAMETKAFELVAAGSAVAAKVLLDGSEYAADKQIYAHGNHRVQAALAEFTSHEHEVARRFSTSSLIATLVLTIVAGAAWWSLATRVREAKVSSELALAKLQSAAAEEASRQKSRFVAAISHELRTPLTAILGYTELLSDPGYPETARADALAAILRNGRHQLQVVNDLLDVAKLAAGQLTVVVGPVDPIALVDEVAAWMRVRAADQGLELQVEYGGDLPRTIPSEALRLRQILVNLIGNAIKFTERGRIRVLVRQAAAAPRVEFVVADDGIGMTPAQVERLFADFSQVDEDLARRGAGTGLGLALSQRLAVLLGGGIEVHSEPGRGSQFVLSLPAPEPATRPLAPAALPPTKPAVGMATPAAGDDRLRGRRILLAEDGRDNQRLVTWLLERAGAEVVVVGDGRQAVAAALASPFDLVLMDMQMPELDGYGATMELRAQASAVPIVALTANAMTDDRRRCLEAGCDDYLSKPIDRAVLIATCARLAGRGGEPRADA